MEPYQEISLQNQPALNDEAISAVFEGLQQFIICSSGPRPTIQSSQSFAGSQYKTPKQEETETIYLYTKIVIMNLFKNCRATLLSILSCRLSQVPVKHQHCPSHEGLSVDLKIIVRILWFMC